MQFLNFRVKGLFRNSEVHGNTFKSLSQIGKHILADCPDQRFTHLLWSLHGSSSVSTRDSSCSLHSLRLISEVSTDVALLILSCTVSSSSKKLSPIRLDCSFLSSATIQGEIGLALTLIGDFLEVMFNFFLDVNE